MDVFAPFISLVILIYSAILHEIAHGFVAYRLGDPTAKLRGRLTLNPIPHIDLFMSILMPALLLFSGSPIIFGGAKPVPVDPFNLRDGRKDMAIVALVGPLTNVIIAIIASVLAHIIYPELSFFELRSYDFFSSILATTIQLNIILAIFNLVPIPPLDGSKVFSLLLSARHAASYLSLESIGMFLLLGLLFFTPLMDVVGAIVTFTISLLGY